MIISSKFTSQPPTLHQHVSQNIHLTHPQPQPHPVQQRRLGVTIPTRARRRICHKASDYQFEVDIATPYLTPTRVAEHSPDAVQPATAANSGTSSRPSRHKTQVALAPQPTSNTENKKVITFRFGKASNSAPQNTNPIPAIIQNGTAKQHKKKMSVGSSRHLSCEHKARRTQCALCNGGSVCVHGKQKHLCKQCKGTSLCVHLRQRSKCKECK